MKHRTSSRQKVRSDDSPSNSRPVAIPGSLGSMPIPIRLPGNQGPSPPSNAQNGDFTRWQSLPPGTPVLGSLRAPPSNLAAMPKLTLPPRNNRAIAQSCPVGVGLLGALDFGGGERESIGSGSHEKSHSNVSEMSALEVLGSMPLSPDLMRDIPIDIQVAEFPDFRNEVEASQEMRPSETNDMDELLEDDDVDALADGMSLQFDLEDEDDD